MSPTIKAALWMTGAIASFTSMAIAGRAVSNELDTFEIMMYRSLVGVVIVITVATLSGTISQVSRQNLGLHFIRNISHFTGQNLWFYAITVIPLAQVFALEFTSPIWAILLAPLILGERLRPIGLLAALVGFIGILIVARPTPETVNVGQLTALLAAIGFALTALFTRKLTRTESITSILFYLTVMQAIFGVIFAGFDGDIALPSAATAPWLVLIACAGLVAHFCMTTALSLAPAAVVMPIDFVRLPLIAVVGAVLYNEAIDIFVVIGAALIFGGNYLNIITESRSKRAEKV
ncbi:EamA domain-containing membrane protein RarD [Shimia isoporae]|uniref:EamA domain-containing membrane protein RarD n=1 Tax=Shimia isoporae TaxID=647720 RepID=A0A4R1NMC9_9RHOB|nr:DMT family transporter [Shimia isoporae]TCL09305.1 EamA domain-containing membrane protein RarD [Shimia isoporae]